MSSVLVILATTCLAQAPQPPSPIARLREAWQAAWNAGELDKVAALYAENAVLLAATGERVTGRDAIRAYFQATVDQRQKQTSASSKSQIAIDSLSSKMCEDQGFDSGTYKETIQWSTTSIPLTGAGTGSGQAKKEVEGDYLVVVSRNGSTWLIQEHAITQKTLPRQK